LVFQPVNFKTELINLIDGSLGEISIRQSVIVVNSLSKLRKQRRCGVIDKLDRLIKEDH
jgi:hypothetical protein